MSSNGRITAMSSDITVLADLCDVVEIRIRRVLWRIGISCFTARAWLQKYCHNE